MTITKTANGSSLTIALEGRLDTNTAPQLDKELKTALNGVEELIFDFANLAYISSAGLRVMLAAQKTMDKQGEMMLRNVNDDIMEVFDMTGFSDVLNIE